MNLFDPIVDETKQHPQFRELFKSPIHDRARTLIEEIATRMGDPNGSFVHHFQGAAFHSRLFEIACFAYLEEAGLSIDRAHAQPDFLAFDDNRRLALEAVTANPSAGQGSDISLREMEQLSKAELFGKVAVEVPKRIDRILVKKLRHKYHTLDHCQDLPLVYMIAPVFEPGAPFYSDDALFHLLYGPPEGVDAIVPAFFQREESAHISAVLFCNQFTVSKFLRLAIGRSPGSRISLVRHGVCYRGHGPDALSVEDFSRACGEGAPSEAWSEGVTLFENPLAVVPLPRGSLPATCHVCVEDGYVQRNVDDFHPVVSFTHIQVNDEGRSR